MVTAPYDEALAALARPLEFAARDSFANIDRVKDLGATLPLLASRIGGFVTAERKERLRIWARDVARWGVLPKTERERLIAAGLRMCAILRQSAPERPAPPPPPVPSRAISAARVTTATTREGTQALAAPLLGLPGIGPSTAQKLAEKGLHTVGDALFFLPRRWDDLRQLVPFSSLVPGTLAVSRGVVKKSRTIFASRRRILDVTFTDDEGTELAARWFHFRGNMAARFAVGARFLISGTPRRNKNDVLEMIHPETIADDAEEGLPPGVRVRYPEIEGVAGRTMEKLCRAVCERFAGEIPDGIPRALAERLQLISQADAARQLHLPPPDLDAEMLRALNEGTAPPQRRLIFDEFFFLQLGLLRRRGAAHREPGLALKAAEQPDRALQKFLKALPFSPTRAQEKAIGEIARDLKQPHPMHRLLQGDVGSGKTVVAFAACELACASGYQAAIMAPTEILAEQHARTLEKWAQATGRSLALLTASTPRAARESQLALLAAGKLDIVAGTHALLAERVSFARLGVVVIDEQHRFGVAQRALLRDKGGMLHAGTRAAPHLLVMTATPIPRTLALTAYGDLDLTLLDELPPGREPPDTRVLHGATGRTRALKELKAALESGRQAYWVCPLIEESDKIDLADVDRCRRLAGARAAAHADWSRARALADGGSRSRDARLSSR